MLSWCGGWRIRKIDWGGMGWVKSGFGGLVVGVCKRELRYAYIICIRHEVSDVIASTFEKNVGMC